MAKTAVGTSVEKLKRDAKRIKEHARFVIVLNDGRATVIDNGCRKSEGLPYAKIIAVLGPDKHEDARLPESILMEIGYCRTRPYARLEIKAKGENGSRWRLTSRRQVRNLLNEEFALVYPHIIACMTSIVLEQRESWKTKGWWWVNGPGPVERGIYFTIAERDELMFRQMVREDIRYRKGKYLSGHAARVRRFLKTYKSSYYTPKQLKRFTKTHMVAEVLNQEHYTPFYRAVLCRCFGLGSHTRLLLEAIAEAFAINVSLSEREEELLHSVALRLPAFKTIKCHRPQRQPNGHAHGGHARGASVFEVLLEKSFREREEIPF